MSLDLDHYPFEVSNVLNIQCYLIKSGINLFCLDRCVNM